MNNKQSAWKLLMTVAATGLLITNCTLTTATDNGSAGSGNNTAGAGNNTAGANNSAGVGNAASGECSPVGKKFSGCICPGNLVSYQTCQSDGTYGNCVCGTNGQGGASNGGNAGAGSNDAGAGGEGGDGALEIVDCYTCLVARCAPEWDACTMNDETNANPDTGEYCISSSLDGSGQIERIMDCITTERAAGLAKRDQVRACGSSIGLSASPNNFVWAPLTMTPETENLMNCMADSPTETMPGNWATSPSNFPASGPRAWDAMTCAKDFCTSAQ